MTSWINAPKEGQKFGSLTIENDADVSISSAIAVKRDEKTIDIYAFVTGCECKSVDKNFVFEAQPLKLTIYTEDHTDSYGKERKCLASHKFIKTAIDAIDGFNTYFSGTLSAAAEKQWTCYETKTDTKGKALDDERLQMILAASADLEPIEGKGELEGVDIPKGGSGGYQRRSVSQGEIFNQRIEWVESQLAEGSKLRSIAAAMNNDGDWVNSMIETWLGGIVG